MPAISYRTGLRLMLLPYAMGILVLVAVPAALSFGLAFFRYDGLSAPVWVGDLNFRLAYTDGLFRLSVQNALALVLVPVPLRVFGAFVLARLMQGHGRFVSWLRAAVFLPSALPVTAFALAWLWILNPLYGPLNLLLRSVGLPAPAWFADPVWAKPGLALMSLWLIGEGFIVCLAALQDMPPELEDAARVDGATGWSYFWRVLLPLLAPILLLLAFRDAILTFQSAFETILVTTGGGPYYATYTLPLFVYEQAFGLLSFGTAGAALWGMYLLTGVIVLLLYVIARQWQIGTTDETFVL